MTVEVTDSQLRNLTHKELELAGHDPNGSMASGTYLNAENRVKKRIKEAELEQAYKEVLNGD